MFDNFQNRRHFGSLDGLRCLSILAVVWHHTASSHFRFALASRGFLGVNLFFVISGYLITTLLLRERRRTGDIALLKFYARRTLRIFPLYYAVLLVYVLLTAFFERDHAARSAFFANLPWFASYTSNWFVKLDGPRVIFYFAWSLAAEEQFYLVWPSIEKRLPRAAVWIALALLTLTVVAQVGLTNAFLKPGTFPHTVIVHVPLAILLGVMLAHALAYEQTFRILAPLLGRRLMAPLALVLLVATVTPASFSMMWAWFADLSMVLLVGACVIREDNGLAPVLTWRPIVHVGVVSYGTYLVHMLAFNLVKRIVPNAGVVLFATTVLTAVLLATLSFRHFESRFLRLKRRFSADPASSSLGAAAISPPLTLAASPEAQRTLDRVDPGRVVPRNE